MRKNNNRTLAKAICHKGFGGLGSVVARNWQFFLPPNFTSKPKKDKQEF